MLYTPYTICILLCLWVTLCKVLYVYVFALYNIRLCLWVKICNVLLYYTILSFLRIHSVGVYIVCFLSAKILYFSGVLLGINKYLACWVTGFLMFLDFWLKSRLYIIFFENKSYEKSVFIVYIYLFIYFFYKVYIL